MPTFDGDIQPIIDYIGAALAEGGHDDALRLWREARFEPFDATDDWGNRGGFGIRTFVPNSTYRRLGNKLQLEEFLARLGEGVADYYDDAFLRTVTIAPSLAADDSWRGGAGRPVELIQSEVDHIWLPGLLRLFISHQSTSAASLTSLRDELLDFGIDGFLAHVKIENTKKWRDQIQQALQSCHAVVAIGTEGFSKSHWCNQEIGWALGRGLLVLPVLAGEEPRGFHADVQGPRADPEKPRAVALSLSKSLTNDPRTSHLLFSGIAQRFRSSTGGQEATDIWNRLSKLTGCGRAAIQEIDDAFHGNAQARTSFKSRDIEDWIDAQRKLLGIEKTSK